LSRRAIPAKSVPSKSNPMISSNCATQSIEA
jgi:hypothetical protein